MSTRNIVKNIRSKELSGNGPKLPTSGQLDYGEIAVNYKKGYETLSLKNDNNEIVSLSVNTVNDVTVNGTSVVSDKTAGITMKGETIPVADTYEQTVYPSPFESKAEHISATDKVDVALKKVETNISKVVTNLNFYYSNLNNDVINLKTTINRLQEITSSIPTMEFVNLGLPSRTLWAKCNIGAATETDYGDYFMWGSTTPDNNHTCNWANTPFNNGSDKYNGTYFTDDVKNILCPNGVLAKNFDAVYKATNGIGRMPKLSEFEELINNTTNEWISDYKGTGVSGRKFTSKTDTSKYIFFPAAGSRIDSSLSHIGSSGGVWSSSLSSDHNLAYSFDFYQGAYDINSHDRYYGWSVRAVRK